jgi:hypothetical protein
VVFSGYSGFLHNKTDHHEITEILFEPKKVKGHVINIPCNVQNYLHTFKISKKSRGLSPFSTIFQLSHGGQFYSGGNR